MCHAHMHSCTVRISLEGITNILKPEELEQNIMWVAYLHVVNSPINKFQSLLLWTHRPNKNLSITTGTDYLCSVNIKVSHQCYIQTIRSRDMHVSAASGVTEHVWRWDQQAVPLHNRLGCLCQRPSIGRWILHVHIIFIHKREVQKVNISTQF